MLFRSNHASICRNVGVDFGTASLLILNPDNRPLAKVPALTLNPSPKPGRGTLKSGSPSLKLGGRVVSYKKRIVQAPDFFVEALSKL